MSCGHMLSFMGHTLVNPAAQVTDVLVMGQLQSQSHSPLPSGHWHLQEHCIPSPAGGIGPDPEPEPVGGMGPEPEPDPVGGMGPEPEPEPVGTGGIVVATAQLHFEMEPLPFLILTVKEHGPTTTFPAPVHFLSQVALPEHAAPSLMMNVQVHLALPSFTFWFVYLAACTVVASASARSEIQRP